MKNKFMKITVVVVVFTVVSSKVILLNAKSDNFIDVSYGLSILKNIENTDVSNIQNEIREKERKEQLFKNRKNLPYSQRFSNSVVIGDSIAEGFLSYGILSQENIFAKKGLISSKAISLVEQALVQNPENIFLAIGMNDLAYYKGSVNKFINNYSTIIDTIQNHSPDIKIYVNSIMPVDKKAIQKNSYLANIDDFNNSLKIMCEQRGITYIDNNDIVYSLENIYQNDGIHLKYPFYPIWAENMAFYSEI